MKTIKFILAAWLALVLSWAAPPAFASCATQETLFSIEYLGVCGYQQSDTFTLPAASHVQKVRIWYDASREAGTVNATLTGPGVSLTKATEKGGCFAGWCEANLVLNQNLAAGTYTVSTSTPYVCENPSGASTLVVYGCAAASSGQAFDVNARSSGSPAALVLDLDLQVASADIGQSGSIYLGALIPAGNSGVWFLNNGRAWQPLGSAIPAFYSGALPSTMSLPVVAGTDVRSLAGTQLFAGYGLDANDMLTRGLMKLAYTIPTDSTPGGGGNGGTPDSASTTEVRGYIDTVMNLLGTALSGGLTAQVQPLLRAVLSNTPTTCPVVNKNFSLSNISNLGAFLASLPNPLTASIDYGNGCTPTSSATPGGTMAGRANLQVDNLQIGQGTAAGSLTLTAAGLSQNGALLADGTVTGNFSGSFGDGLAGTGNLSLSQFLLPGGQRTSGTVGITASSSERYAFDLKLTSSNNVSTSLVLDAQKAGDDYLISTARPGSVNQYAVTLHQVKMNTELCASYPIGGTASFSAAGQTWNASFTNACNGSYSLQ